MRENLIPQTYEEITNLISQTEDISPETLFLIQGTVVEGTNKYIEAELGCTLEEGVCYTFFNPPKTSRSRAPILARINTRLVNIHEDLFQKIGDNNKVVVDDQLVEATYLAVCIGSSWYHIVSKQKGKALDIPSLNIQTDLIPISS